MAPCLKRSSALNQITYLLTRKKAYVSMGKKVYAVIAAIMVTALIMPSAGTSNTAYAYFGDVYSEEQSKKSTLEEVLKLAEDRVTSVESQLGGFHQTR